jgi:hypothetical protein
MSTYHVVPIDDLREHDTDNAGGRCWCRPEETFDEHNNTIWVHHAMDRREEYEEGRKLS